MVKERGYGTPRSDIKRAMAHYNISEEEYLANPGNYPLPEKGTGLTTGRAAGSNQGKSIGLGTALAIGLILWALLGRRK